MNAGATLTVAALGASLLLTPSRRAFPQALGVPDNVRILFRGSALALDYGSSTPGRAGFSHAIGVTGTVTFGGLQDDSMSRPLHLNVTASRATSPTQPGITSLGLNLQLGMIASWQLIAGLGYVDSGGVRRLHVPLEVALPLTIALRPMTIVPWVQAQADYYYVGGGYKFNRRAGGFGVDIDTRTNFGVRLVALRWNGPVGEVWSTSVGVHWSTHGNTRAISEVQSP